MKTASRVIYLVGAIINALTSLPILIYGVLEIIGGIAILVTSSGTRGGSSSGGDPRLAAAFVIFLGFVLLAIGFLLIVGSIIGFIGFARAGKGKVLHIFAIIIGALLIDVPLILPGIFSIIASKQRRNVIEAD